MGPLPLPLLCMSVLPYVCPYNPPKQFSFGVNASISIGRELRCLPYAEFFLSHLVFTNKSIDQKKWYFFSLSQKKNYHLMFLSTILLVETFFFSQFLLKQFVSKRLSCHNKWIESKV